MDDSATKEMETAIHKIENLVSKAYEGKRLHEVDYEILLQYWKYELAKIKRLIEIQDNEQDSISVYEWFALTKRKEKVYRFQFEE